MSGPVCLPAPARRQSGLPWTQHLRDAVPVTIYYLEMRDPAALRAVSERAGLEVEEVRHKQYPLNRFLYQLVGGDWDWTDKLVWTDDDWRALVERDEHRTFMARCDGAIAGYYELEKRGGDVEILYFGLAPGFIGRGFGGDLLTRAIRSAWSWPGCERVWVHTCSLDHPSALANYRARGLQLYKQETQ